MVWGGWWDGVGWVVGWFVGLDMGLGVDSFGVDLFGGTRGRVAAQAPRVSCAADDYKVTQAEGFGKVALFEILDTLEQGTRPLMLTARERLASEKGEAALQPYNSGFAMAGDITKKLDPYFPFEKSVEQWGRSFAALGIAYSGASMNLDLLDRKGKYSNGFCHWPQPAWIKPDGSWQPTVTHFTSLADPAAVGSGLTGLTTLMHEAGHAAQ